jgi:peroxiredoxin
VPNVGEPAPEITFQAPDRVTLTLAELKGKQNVVIAFYAAAFTGG